MDKQNQNQHLNLQETDRKEKTMTMKSGHENHQILAPGCAQ